MDENLEKELKQLERRKQKARRANDPAEEANLYNAAGELLAEYRLFERAIEEHKMELHLSESLNDPIAVAIAHRKLGECLCECQDFKQALVHQQKYLQLSRKSQNLVEEQRALATIGRTWFQSAVLSSDMLQAQSAFKESLSLCDELRDVVKEKELLEMRARLYLNLGLVNNNLKNQRKCMKYIEKALAIAVNQNLKDTEYRCHFSLGEIKLSENCPAEALQCFERARKVAQHQKKKFDEADTLVQMGQILLHLGDFKGAKNILKKCFKTMKHGNLVDELRSSLIKAIKGTRLLDKLLSTKDESLLKNYEDLGDLYSDVKCYSKATHYYLKQFELSEELHKTNKEKAVICVSLAASYSDNKQYEKAKKYFHKELQFREGEPQEQCDTWCNIAEVSELAGGCFEEVEMAYKNALKCAERCESSNRKVRVLKLLSELKRKEGNCDKLSEYSEEYNIEEDTEMSEEQSQCVDDNDDDEEEGDSLIQEEMEFSDSDEGEQHDKQTSTSNRPSIKSINKRNEKGETVLHVAAIKGDYNLAKTSIEKGVSIHSRDYCGWQPLHEACNHGNLDIVALLLDKGADINDPGGPHCRGMTPLHDAAQNGHVDVVKLLIARGASVTQQNKDRHTALDLVLHAINEDDDDDDDPEELDPDLIQIREKMTQILRNAASSAKHPPTKMSELRRRDKLEVSDESDVDSCSSQNFVENSQVFSKAGDMSRKRKSSFLELDSDDGMTVEIDNRSSRKNERNKAKIARVSENFERESLVDDDSQDRSNGVLLDSQYRISHTSAVHVRGVWRDGSENSEASQDGMSILKGLKDNSQNNEDTQTLASDPLGYVGLHVSRSPQQSQSDCSSNISHILRSAFGLGKSTHTCTKSDQSKTFSPSIDKTSKTSVPKNANTTSYLDPITGSTQQESGRPALIPESEYLESTNTTDGWLIDDMPKKSDKRKRSGNIITMLRDSYSPRMRNSSNAQRRNPKAPSQRSHNITSSGKKTRLRQTRLSRHVVSGRSSPNEICDNRQPEPSNASASLFSGVAPLSDANAPMRLRVKVKDEQFLIPCPNVSGERKTVKWLAEQAAFRYYSASGLKPILSLSTAEGASLSPADLITDVLSNNELVNASVETWELPPIAERYKAACINAEKEVHKGVLNAFQSNPNISSVEFCDMVLTSATVLPLFRSLQFHDQLVRLSLSGNRIGDGSLQHFISALPCLTNLAVLILSCNGITHKGIRNLASSLTQDNKISQVWSNLKELDISFNTITDRGVSSLATILCSCPDLQILNIRSCGLGQNTFHQRSTFIEAMFGLTRLYDLNVSHNQIEGEGLTSLLSAISCSSVEILNLSSTIGSHDNTFANALALAEYLNENNCCIKKLLCGSCYLRDEDLSILARTKKILTSVCELDLSQNDIGNEGVLKLVQSVQCNTNLQHLNMSGNIKVTNDSLHKFLTHSSSLEYLDLSSCGLRSPLPASLKNLETAVSNNLKFLNLSCNSLDEHDLETLSDLWSTTWRQKARVSTSKSIVMFSVQKLYD